MEYSITEYPVPVILKKISAERLTGALKVKGEDFKKKFYFIGGILISASSTKLDEKISFILQLTGQISEEQFDTISGLLHGEDREVGEILVQNNFVNREELEAAMIYLTRRIILSTFLLNKGTWEFKKKMPMVAKRGYIEIQLPSIIVEGVRRMRNIKYFKDKIYFHGLKAVGIPHFLTPMLKDDEIQLYKELEKCGGLSNAEIISKLNLPPGFYCEKIILFLMLDVVQFFERKSDFDRAENTKELLEINEKLKSGELTDYSILGLKETASIEEIEKSYREKSKLYHPDRFGTTAASEIKKIAGFVSEGIEDAYRSLIAKDKRKRRREEEEREKEAERKRAAEKKREEERRKREEEKRREEERKKRLEEKKKEGEEIKKEVERRREAEKKIEADRRREEERKKRLEEKKKEEEEKKIKAQEEEEKRKAEEKEEQEDPLGDKTQSKEIPRHKAHSLFEQGEQLYTEKKFHDAVELLKQATKLDPARGKYFLLLGQCQSELFYFQGDAERNLKTAIELEPTNPDAVYALGVLFRKQKKFKLSEKCFQRALEIDRTHIESGKAISQMHGQPGKKGSFLSIFQVK